MSLTDDTHRIAEQLRSEVEQISDRQTRDIVAGWARAWDEVAPELDAVLQELLTAAGTGRVTRMAMLRSQRLARALGVIAERLNTLAADAGVTVVGDLQRVVALAGQAQHDLIASQLPPQGQAMAVSWSHVDAHAISAIVTRSTQRIHKLTKPLSPDAMRVMRRELIRGVAVGANPRERARRMVARTEGVFDGGASRALTIARTETLDAHRAAAMLAQQANADVLQGWVWTTDLSPRTCMACWSMEGTTWPLDEPGPDGHQNCQCTRTPVTLSWRDLGFDIPEPDPVGPDKAALFDDLSAADQKQVLGPGKWQAWQAGDFPMDRWAVKQSNDGWRDSYVPASLPKSERLAS